MTLREKQSYFAVLLAKLILWISDQGWAVTLGESYRGDAKGHMPGSLHYVRLAQDLNLFVGGKWMTANCPEWQKIGTFWKSLDPLCAWGGDFGSVDLNHVSLKHEGKM